ncbi:transglutaminase-like domain-containing protein [Anaeromicropila populeti]|uniref:Transglutaminase-like superfamily protein n=1 Tax=Anaeromicropila populeti TaxID=37658 RepID=A0A1I6HJQ7_9FIRM|nr:transglutaminase-like domain-containing protein [Anaeromicropila populeti]SFR54550.1 Transglutaminase-like superfamily protein [Anaeromicropila populeti]
MKFHKKNQVNDNAYNQLDASSSYKTGITLGTQKGETSHSILLLCLVRAFLVFLGAFGTVGFYLAGFQIPCNYFILGIVLFLTSLYCGLLYYNKWTMNIGYIILLLLFLFPALALKTYISSGFAAIRNITYDVIDEIYILPSIRHYAEYVPDRTLAITICTCFLGAFLCMLLNCMISGYMSFLFAFFITFPLIQIPLYFDQTPGMIWFALIAVCWLTLLVLKKSNAYRTKGTAKLNAKGLLQNSGIAASFVIVISLLVMLVTPKGIFHTPDAWNTWKQKTDQYIRNYMIVGFSSFFNKYDSAGGISGGQLGGISSVRPDFETDLKVRFTPYSSEPLYLKAYTGIEYTRNQWINTGATLKSVQKQYNEDAQKYYDSADFHRDKTFFYKEKTVLEENKKKGSNGLSGKMEITNVGAVGIYLYLPYYPYLKNDFQQWALSSDILVGKSSFNIPYEITYFPYVQPVHASKEAFSAVKMYEEENLWQYTSVPDELNSVLGTICTEAGFHGTQEEIIQQMQNYFLDNYKYTMSPGLTPQKSDAVIYFLTKSRKGFCVHFASSATLLLRAMGIPARYVEGYTIPYSKVLDSDLVAGEKYEDWFSGNTELGKTAVVEVDVNDSYAHAWVEVFQEDFGWVPVDFTPPGEGINNESGSFWSFFSSLFRNDSSSQVSDFDSSSQSLTTMRPGTKAFLIVLIIGFTFLPLLVLFVKIMLQKLHWRKKLTEREYRTRIMNQYDFINHYLKLAKFTEQPTNLHSFNEILLKEQLSVPYEIIGNWIQLVEKVSFSQEPLTSDELEKCAECYLLIQSGLHKKLSVWKRFYVFLKI